MSLAEVIEWLFPSETLRSSDVGKFPELLNAHNYTKEECIKPTSINPTIFPTTTTTTTRPGPVFGSSGVTLTPHFILLLEIVLMLLILKTNLN
jgi:hypothetical protein